MKQKSSKTSERSRKEALAEKFQDLGVPPVFHAVGNGNYQCIRRIDHPKDAAPLILWRRRREAHMVMYHIESSGGRSVFVYIGRMFRVWSNRCLPVARRMTLARLSRDSASVCWRCSCAICEATSWNTHRSSNLWSSLNNSRCKCTSQPQVMTY